MEQRTPSMAVTYKCRTVALLSLVWLCSRAAQAEDPALHVGTRIRLSMQAAGADDGRKVIGSLVALDETSFRVRDTALENEVVIPRTTVSRVEISVRRSQKRRAALLFLAAGAAAGALSGWAAGDDREGIVRFTAGQKAGLFGVFGGSLGVLFGVAVAPGEEWRIAPIDSIRLSSVHGVSREGRLYVTFRF